MEDMVGKWKLEKRDPNFEEFLVCRQVISEVLIMAKEPARSGAFDSQFHEKFDLKSHILENLETRPDQVGWILRKLMTSTTVDTEYKLDEDKANAVMRPSKVTIIFDTEFVCFTTIVFRNSTS
mgnify:CR=1 FL=1